MRTAIRVSNGRQPLGRHAGRKGSSLLWCVIASVCALAGCQDDPTSRPTALSPENDGVTRLVRLGEEEFDVGKIDGSFEHTFWFVNCSDQPVALKEIRPSCTCTAAASEKRRFEPGERGSLRVTGSVKGKASGRHNFSVDMTFEGAVGAVQATRLKVVAYNQPEIQYLPEVIPLSSLNGRLQTAHVRIADYRLDPIDIEQVTSSDSGIRMSVNRIETERTGERIIHLMIEASEKQVSDLDESGYFELYSSDKASPPIKWPFTVRRIGRLLYSSPAIVMRHGPDRSYVGEAIIRSLDGRRLEFLSEPTESLAVTVERQEGNECIARIRVHASTEEARRKTDAIVVKVLSPLQQYVVLPLLWPHSSE